MRQVLAHPGPLIQQYGDLPSVMRALHFVTAFHMANTSEWGFRVTLSLSHTARRYHALLRRARPGSGVLESTNLTTKPYWRAVPNGSGFCTVLRLRTVFLLGCEVVRRSTKQIRYGVTANIAAFQVHAQLSRGSSGFDSPYRRIFFPVIFSHHCHWKVAGLFSILFLSSRMPNPRQGACASSDSFLSVGWIVLSACSAFYQ